MSVEDLKKALDEKAKTTNEILAYVHDAKGFIGIIPYMGETLVRYGEQKWVPLEALKDFVVVPHKQLFGKCAYVDFEGNPAIVCNLCRFYHGLQKGCSWEEEKKKLFEASESLSPKEVKDVAIARKELASGKCKTFKTADEMIADLHENEYLAENHT